MVDEMIKIFRKNFPYIIRYGKTVEKILGNPENKVFEKRDENNNLIAVSVINKNTIILFCVDEKCRNKGIGSYLLKQSEEYVKNNGYKSINIGVGYDYLMPGVPTKSKVYNEVLCPDDIYENVNDDACLFFKKRGYYHSWEDANCFDMRMELQKFDQNEKNIRDTINSITYTWAKESDLDKIKICTDDAWPEFTPYYKDKSLYSKDSNQRVMVAKYKNEVVGTLIVSCGTEADDVGSVGCTAVRKDYQGKHIAVNMVKLGTKYLKDIGYKKAFLGYTYSGLDKMYGYAGYKICVYYFMAKKDF